MLLNQDSLAEWSKALASSASPQGRGFEPDSCQPSLFETTARVKVQVKHGHYIFSRTICNSMSRSCCLSYLRLHEGQWSAQLAARRNGSKLQSAERWDNARCRRRANCDSNVEQYSCMVVATISQSERAVWTMAALPSIPIRTVWPSGLRRWLKAPVRKGVGSNPTAVSLSIAELQRTSFVNCRSTLSDRVLHSALGRHLQQLQDQALCKPHTMLQPALMSCTFLHVINTALPILLNHVAELPQFQTPVRNGGWGKLGVG